MMCALGRAAASTIARQNMTINRNGILRMNGD
jgi:hypothetical protein